MNKHQDFLIKFVHIKFMKLKNDSINSKVSYKTQEGISSPLQKYIIVNVNDLEYIYRYYHKHLSGKIPSQVNSNKCWTHPKETPSHKTSCTSHLCPKERPSRRRPWLDSS